MTFLIPNVAVSVLVCSAVATAAVQGAQNQPNDGDCFPLMKAHFNQSEQDIFSDYIQYATYKGKNIVPDLSSFTLTFWILFDRLDQNATVFTYVEAPYKNTLISVKYVASLGWGFKILDKEMLLNTPVSSVRVGSWYHILVYWSGQSSGISFWIDGHHMHTQLYTEDEVIPGGGVLRSGHSEQSIAYWDEIVTEKQPDEGFNGWITLLKFDSRPFAIERSTTDYIRIVKQQVEYLMSTCTSAANKGNIIDWQSTHLKGYGGVTPHLAMDKCGHF